MLDLKRFSELVKAQQKPYEDALLASMQEKVNWLKKYSTYDLNQRQKDSIEKDKIMIQATEAYVTVQHKIITYLFSQLEQLQTESAAHFADKTAAEKALIDYIRNQHEREVQPAA